MPLLETPVAYALARPLELTCHPRNPGRFKMTLTKTQSCATAEFWLPRFGYEPRWYGRKEERTGEWSHPNEAAHYEQDILDDMRTARRAFHSACSAFVQYMQEHRENSKELHDAITAFEHAAFMDLPEALYHLAVALGMEVT